MLEKEIKVLIDYNMYNDLIKKFDFEEPYTQTNYYYSNGVVDSNMTIRVREIDGEMKLQVKNPKYISGSLHIKEEHECQITNIPDSISKSAINELIGLEIPEDLNCIGKLITERRICNKFDSVEIAIDINKYLDITDYELEIEYRNEYPNDLIDTIKKMGICLSEDVKGKNTRFNHRLKEVNDSACAS